MLSHVQWRKNSILTCLNLSPICNQVCSVHNMLHTWNYIRKNDPELEFDIVRCQLSLKTMHYAIFAVWHNLGILICDFMQWKSSTEWQRLEMVVIDCITYREICLSWCNRYVAVVEFYKRDNVLSRFFKLCHNPGYKQKILCYQCPLHYWQSLSDHPVWKDMLHLYQAFCKL